MDVLDLLLGLWPDAGWRSFAVVAILVIAIILFIVTGHWWPLLAGFVFCWAPFVKMNRTAKRS